MSEAAKRVIARMAAERGITADEMRDLIQEAIHSSSDLTLRREVRSRFGKREMTTEEFIILLAEMIEQGCGNYLRLCFFGCAHVSFVLYSGHKGSREKEDMLSMYDIAIEMRRS